MTEEIRTLKMFFPSISIIQGTSMPTDSGVVAIPANGSFTAEPGSSLIDPHNSGWVIDQFQLAPPVAGSPAASYPVARMPGGCTFRLHNTQKIDLSGYLQMGLSLVPMGTASQRTFVPQLPGRMDGKAPNMTYLYDATVWSSEPLTQADINNLQAPRQRQLPSYPTGTLNTTQVLGSQGRLFVSDNTTIGLIGFLKESFQSQQGMGETVSTAQVYCTRVIFGQMATPSTAEIEGAYGNDTYTDDWDFRKFFISIPSSFEVLNVALLEPDELEYLTYMQRSVLAPEGRVDG